MVRFFIAQLLIILTINGIAQETFKIENLKNSVVLLALYKENGQDPAIATGYIIGSDATSIFIMTANHVFESDNGRINTDSVYVQFHKLKLRVKGQFRNLPRMTELDVAFIKVKKPKEANTFLVLDVINDFKNENEADELHNYSNIEKKEWWYKKNYISQKSSDATGLFFGLSVIVSGGTSGSPLFNKKFELIGMVLENQKAIKIDKILQAIEDKSIAIPINLLGGNKIVLIESSPKGGPSLPTLTITTKEKIVN